MDRAQILFLELNEINFRYLEHYIAQGELPVFRDLFERHGFAETLSESQYDHLEPWIQWVTAHTGLDYREHGVFRLGDIVDHDFTQIWETLEDAGLKVGAISPMNAKCRVKSPAFFVPDPWTETEIHAGPGDRRLYDAIRRAVNGNAAGAFDLGSMVQFAAGGMRSANLASYLGYANLTLGARSRPWNKALLLDHVLADVFIRLVRSENPDFATLFLNAGAHIQHHYLFNSSAYSGENRNPAWYAAPGHDPLRDVYRLYDQLIGRIAKAFPDARLMLATGLHQEPYHATTYYWRLRDHAAFLARLGVEHIGVEPRMSRDFLITCADAQSAARAQSQLAAVCADDGTPLFEIDNRGRDLFVMLTYPNDIPPTMAAGSDTASIENLRDHVAFVAIKNGEHDGIGYFCDTGSGTALRGARINLRSMPDRVIEAFGLNDADMRLRVHA